VGSEQSARAIRMDITFRMILILLEIQRVGPGLDGTIIGSSGVLAQCRDIGNLGGFPM
jgi:hypothetical protein